jgi:hypothetical protein
MSTKIILRPQITDLQTDDPKLQVLHCYALHLSQREDPAQTAHNASLLFLTVVNAFQHAGITDLDWVPSLYIEVASKEYEVSRHVVLESVNKARPVGQNLATVFGTTSQTRQAYQAICAGNLYTAP